MKLFKLSAVMLMLLATSACATREIPRIADSACVLFAPIRYSIAPVQPDGKRNVENDPGNQFDTNETIAGVKDHNAAIHKACGSNR